ncbi:MAG: hypothetical protein BGO78_06585 [Chloroflexi bacterium 44-23]|nr:MAG: hypothetical protein BGO78_06585 [Chloroflexi bacterium 44-23]
MAHLLYGHVIADGLRINYYRTGGEKPAVVLVHSLGEYGLGWGRFPVFIEPGYDVTAIDLRGHGMSAKPEQGYTLENLSADIFWTIRTLNLIKPVVIGHSLGAAVTAAFARTHPALISGIVLIDPPWRMEQSSLEEKILAAQFYLDRIRSLKAKSLEELMEAGRQEHPNWEESEYMQWAKGIQLVSENTVEWFTTEKRPWQEIAAGLTVPGLLLSGEPELGAIVTPQVATAVAGMWKKGEIHHFPGAGHFIHRDQYFKFRDVVRRFLRYVY